MPVPAWRRDFLVANLDLEQATGVEGAQWEHFQLSHLDDESTFRIEVKARQIAWSWLIAAEAVAEAHADQWHGAPHDSIFVSINLQEAAEKIRYARRIYDTLVAGFPGLSPLTRDSTLNLEFANGARLTSLPARPPRGRARADVYLDEFAHVQYDRDIYTAALPIISKGGRLRIGSSPFGAAGLFWEIAQQPLRRYPGYTRAITPWWGVRALCANISAARRMAPTMATAARVARFGNARIKAIYANMEEADFRQEYEAAYVDETRSYFTWDELRAATHADLTHYRATCTGSAIGPALDAIQAMLYAVATGRIERVLAAGVDVGRTHDTTELALVGLSTTGQLPLRALLTLRNTPYDQQAEMIAAVLTQLPILRLWIDRNGIGSQLAESLERQYPAIAQGQNFTSQSKQLWATGAKMLLQQRRAVLPADRDLSYQIHSIKRMISGSKQSIFDTEANEKHHADQFWAWALALAAARVGEGQADADALAGLFEHIG